MRGRGVCVLRHGRAVITNTSLHQTSDSWSVGPMTGPHPRGFATTQPNSNALLDGWRDAFDTLSRSPATAAVSQGFCDFHDMSGMPWSATIVVSSFALRFFISLPGHVTSHKTSAKREILNKTMTYKVLPAMKKAVLQKREQKGWTEEKMIRTFDATRRDFYNKEVIRLNCAASKLLLPIYIQVPVWITISVGLRNLSIGGGRLLDDAAVAEAQARLGQLSSQGFGWVHDLTLPDAYYVLPVLVGTMFLLNFEMMRARVSREMLTQGGTKPMPKTNTFITCLVRGLSVAMVPLTANVPAAMALYWSTSVTAGVAVNLLMLSPKFRRLVRIPVTETEPSHPYQNTWANMKDNAQHSVKWVERLKKLK